MMRWSDHLDSPNHYVIYAYQKPATLLIALRHLLGDTTFARVYQGYLRTWAFHQPKPWDFFAYFDAAGDGDLSWFWRSWYYETWTLDQSVASVTAGPRGTDVVVRDLGDAPMPARLTIALAGGDTLQREIPVSTWLGGTRTATVTRGRVVTAVEIDARHGFPDIMRKNNFWSREIDSLPAALPVAVRSDLVRAAALLRREGYRPEGAVRHGALAARSDDSLTLSLDAGVRYAILGGCDTSCADVDLRLAGPASATLAQDAGNDDTPLLEFTAPAAGKYWLEMAMWRCRTGACAWGVRVFRR